MTPAVFVPSVPWRWPALREVLAGLARQTVRVPVTVLLDGYDGGGAGDVRRWVSALELEAAVVRVEQPGAGARWRYIAQRVDDDVVAVSLDDDLVPGPLYVQNTLGAWQRLGEPLSWCGSVLGSRELDYVRMTASTPADARLGVAGAGGLCVPARMLRGIDGDPDAERFFGPRGHDEALVSWWLAVKHRVRLWRPRGAADVRDHPLAHDPRSQWIAAGGRCPPLVELLERRGWPVVDPPGPRDPYAGFRGKPLR